MSSKEETKTSAETQSGAWAQTPWRKLEKYVYHLQKRIYRASEQGNAAAVHRLQQLLMRSEAARTLAVRQVTQDNQGKKTAGVDGKLALNSLERLELVEELRLPRLKRQKPLPVRRVWIPKPGKAEKRPLGIPTIRDRATQALAKMALEPEWEVKFEPNSYGFRPGRGCWDAITAIFDSIKQKPKWVLDADIAGCFDHINQTALLHKLDTYPTMRRLVKGWLEAGVKEGKELYLSEGEGTPQGGVISPLLANIALHGLEIAVKTASSRLVPLQLVRYADDFVVFSPDKEALQKAQKLVEAELAGVGLELKASKTRVAHSSEGFDFLGFNVRQYKVGKYRTAKSTRGKPLGFKTLIKPSKKAIKRHMEEVKEKVKQMQSSSQEELIDELNPIIRGWSEYYRTVASSKTFSDCDNTLYHMLRRWGKKRHRNKGPKWIVRKYWGIGRGKGWTFATLDGKTLVEHTKISIRRHVKVQGRASPYDGNLVYWAMRLKDHPLHNGMQGKLLARQQGRCAYCGLLFRPEDLMHVDHIIPRKLGGKDWIINRQVLHKHCHHQKTAKDGSRSGEGQKVSVIETV